VTLREFSEVYLEDYCKIRNRSWKRKRDSFRALNKKLGDTELESLRPADLDSYFRERKAARISNATLNRDLAHLKHMLRFALEREVVKRDPITAVKKFKEEKRARRRPTDEEVDHFIASAELRVRPMFGFIRETGCRLSEAMGLKRSQVRLDDGIVIFTDGTKSGKFRVVPLTEECQRWLLQMPELPGCPYVFWNPTSQTKWYNVRKPINAAIKASKLDWFRVKDLRRHYGITLSENGAEMHVIQAMLGHASVKTTETYYAQFSPHYAATRALQVLEGRKQKDGRQMGGGEMASKTA
jgi:integrase/recombinase XerD